MMGTGTGVGMSKKLRIKRLEESRQKFHNRMNELEGINARLGKRLDNLEWVLEVTGLIQKNEFVGCGVTHLEPLFMLSAFSKHYKKLEEYLGIELEFKPEAYEYVKKGVKK